MEKAAARVRDGLPVEVTTKVLEGGPGSGFVAMAGGFGTIEEVDSDVICGFEACECVVCMMSEK